MDRFIRTFGPAAALLLAALVAVLVVFVMGQGVGVIHGSGGCNHIPLVNGQPAYPCANLPSPH
jgi:hypothetical protein